MSILNFRGRALPRLLVSAAVLAVLLSPLSCRSNDDAVDERFYGYFLRDAKTMQSMGLPIYWLGRGFTAGALTFQGPYTAEFGGEVEGGGIFTHYTSWLDGTPGEGRNVGLEITVYGPGAWELAKERIMNPQRLASEGEATRRTVAVQGRKAELMSIPRYSRPVGQLRLILDLDAVVVVAAAQSDGTDYSVFTKNPDLFVQVIDQYLRPYPE